MWIAQHPCGTWCSYKEKPLEKMGGWDGDVYSVLRLSSHLISWRGTLEEMSYKDYCAKYKKAEVVL